MPGIELYFFRVRVKFLYVYIISTTSYLINIKNGHSIFVVL